MTQLQRKIGGLPGRLRSRAMRPLRRRRHRMAGIDVIDDGFELRCRCGWRSSARRSADLLDAWLEHRSERDR